MEGFVQEAQCPGVREAGCTEREAGSEQASGDPGDSGSSDSSAELSSTQGGECGNPTSTRSWRGRLERAGRDAGSSGSFQLKAIPGERINYTCKGPIFKCSHIHRFSGAGASTYAFWKVDQTQQTQLKRQLLVSTLFQPTSPRPSQTHH